MPDAEEVAFFDFNSAAEIAERLHAVLDAAGLRASVRVCDGEWIVRVIRSRPRRSWAFPPEGGDREEWLAVLAEKLEAGAGVRPEIEVED